MLNEARLCVAQFQERGGLFEAHHLCRLVMPAGCGFGDMIGELRVEAISLIQSACNLKRSNARSGGRVGLGLS